MSWRKELKKISINLESIADADIIYLDHKSGEIINIGKRSHKLRIEVPASKADFSRIFYISENREDLSLVIRLTDIRIEKAICSGEEAFNSLKAILMRSSIVGRSDSAIKKIIETYAS